MECGLWCNRNYRDQIIALFFSWLLPINYAERNSLHWRHNDNDGVSNHQPHHCLLNRLFRRRSQKTSKLRVTGLCAGNSPGPVNSPHKGPVTRKMFPFDDVIMLWYLKGGLQPPSSSHFSTWGWIIIENDPLLTSIVQFSYKFSTLSAFTWLTYDVLPFTVNIEAITRKGSETRSQGGYRHIWYTMTCRVWQVLYMVLCKQFCQRLSNNTRKLSSNPCWYFILNNMKL